jgi:putative thioredoxin
MVDQQKPDSPWIIETTAETFDQDVFEKSHETLIVVDFWAEWCGPCRQLSPVLEGLARELEGKFILVKANTEEVPEAAGKFQVTGIPAVYAVMDGEVVDAFQGALPEEQIRGWLDSLATASTLAEAQRLEELSPEGAEAKYRTVAEQLPNESLPKIGLARTLLAQERFDECQELIDASRRRTGESRTTAEAGRSSRRYSRIRGSSPGLPGHHRKR